MAQPSVARKRKKVSLDSRKARSGWLFVLPFMIGILLICTAYLVDGSFSPFLYFRF